MFVDIVPFGDVPASVRREVRSALRSTYGVDVTSQDAHPLPDSAYNSHRDQYDSEALAEAAARFGNGDLNLGLTETDLYDPNEGSMLDVLKSTDDLTCVFGVAFLDGNGGVCSTYRLRSTGGGRTQGQLSDRIRKEAVKQVGHMLGLAHCENSWCAMHYAPAIRELDERDESLCDSCSRAVSVSDDADTADAPSTTGPGGADTGSADTRIFDPDGGGDTAVYDEANAPATCPSCGHGLTGYDATAYCPSCGEPL